MTPGLGYKAKDQSDIKDVFALSIAPAVDLSARTAVLLINKTIRVDPTICPAKSKH